MRRWTRPTSAASRQRCGTWRETIQFVVITHNRGTIEAADALYGVTVGDDAVSRVVSMRLDGRRMQPDRNGHGPDATEPELIAVGPAE